VTHCVSASAVTESANESAALGNYQKKLSRLKNYFPDKIPCSCVRILCSVEIISFGHRDAEGGATHCVSQSFAAAPQRYGLIWATAIRP
jgi:hypothetical protein